MRRLVMMLAALVLLAALCVPVLATANGTWDEGYEAGLADGAAGFANGDAKRYKEQMSIANGYDGGYAEGYLKGWWEAWKDRRELSDYERGFGDGYRVGWKDAEEKVPYDRAGRSAEFSGEYRAGFMEGYDDGYSESLDEIYEYALHNWDGDFEPLEQPLIVNGWPFKGSVALKDGTAYASARTLNEIMGTRLTGSVLPIRDAAAQTGWDVVWNRENRQVVMLNKSLLLEQALSGRAGRPDPDFSALDKLLAQFSTRGFHPAGVRTAEGTLRLSFSAYNTLDGGDATVTPLKYTVVSDGRSFHAALSFKGRELSRLLTLLKVEGIGGLPAEGTLELICNGKELYIGAPFLSLWDPRFAGAEWVRIALPGQGFESWDTAGWLYQRLRTESRDGKDPMRAYQTFARDCVVLDMLGGPEVLSEKNGIFTWKVDTARINEILARLLGDKSLRLFREFNAAAQLSVNGWNSCSLVIRPDTDQAAAVLHTGTDQLKKAALSWLTGLLDVRLGATLNDNPDGGSGTATLHWKNVFSLTAEGKGAASPGGELLLTPPEGAVIVDY